jgi:membrane protease YdiL (CAAX protease family)
MVLDASGALNHFDWNLLPCICFCALLNALSEELIFRFVIHGNLQDVVPKKNVLMLSAVLFGLPHYWGYPSGLVGVAMAGFLGYVLSKITYETQGLGLAWGIHFVQDVIIFTALFMMYY